MNVVARYVLAATASVLVSACAQAATITVTGGSAASVVSALTTSSPGDIIQIGDNLTYDFSSQIAGYSPVLVSGRTLRAAPGATPTIYADPTPAAGVFSVFRVSGDATNPGTVQGFKFVSGPTAWLNYYVDVRFTKYVNILDNDFAMQSLERNFNSGQAIHIEGSSATGPTILIERNLFHTTGSSPYNSQFAVHTDGGASGFIARNNIVDMSGRTTGNVYGFYLNNEGSFNSTTLINNTLVFAPSATSVGVNLALANPMITGFIQNNIFLNADIGYQDLNTSGSSSLTLNYNLFDNVGSVYSAQPADVITTNNNFSGVGIAGLDGWYQPAWLSPARDGGLNGLNYGAVDFWGDQRVRFGTVDIGAVEIPEPGALTLALAVGLCCWRVRRR